MKNQYLSYFAFVLMYFFASDAFALTSDVAAPVYVGEIPLEYTPDATAIDHLENTAYVISETRKILYKIGIKSMREVASFIFSDKPQDLTIYGERVYVTAGKDSKGVLYIFDKDLNPITTVPLGKAPVSIAAGNGLMAIACSNTNSVLVMDGETLKVRFEANIDMKPNHVEIDGKRKEIVVSAAMAANAGKGSVEGGKLFFLDLETGAVKRSVNTVQKVKDLKLNTVTDRIILTNAASGIDIMNPETLAIEKHIELENAGDVDINRSTGAVVVLGPAALNIIEGTTLVPFQLDKNVHDISINQYSNQAVLASGNSVMVIQLPNPVPVVTNIIPKSARAHDEGFNLKIEGDRFITTSSASFGSSNVQTAFKDNKELEAAVPSNLLTTPGSVPVTVTNPAPAGGTSNPYPFIIKLPVPVIQSITPDNMAARSPDFIIKAIGSGFSEGCRVNFNGTDLETVFINSNELNANVTSSLIQAKGTYLVVVTTSDGQNSNFVNFTVTDPYPRITDLSPNAGQAGTVVTITGENFNYAPVKVFFKGTVPTQNIPPYQGGTEGGVQATIISNPSSPPLNLRGGEEGLKGGEGELQVIVPAGAAIGPIAVTTSIGSATSSSNFTVINRQDFVLIVSPQTVSIPYNGKASAIVSLQSTGTENFTGLVKLEANISPYQGGTEGAVNGAVESGLSPASGITTAFSPQYISANQTTVLFINATTALSPQPTVLTIEGRATIDGNNVVKTASLTLSPIPQGTTILSGQVLASKDVKPIKNVTLRIGSLSATTNDAGNFIFIDPPAGEQIVVIDGYTANHDGISYPSDIPAPVTIQGGIDNTLQYPLYLHEVKTSYYTVIDPTTDTIVADPEIPYFEMKIPQGVRIIGHDGLPNERISVTTVPVDRLPISPTPEGVYAKEVYMYYFFKPGGGTPTQPIPVKMPNTFGGLPGERINLWYYDESFTPDPDSNQWKMFGMGTVSEDGRQIIPDEGVGIPKFCCGASVPSPSGPPSESTPEPTPRDGPCPIGDPVDPFSGMYIYNEKDIGYPYPSMLRVERLYNSGNMTIGPFGVGTNINYNYYLQGSDKTMIYIPPEGRWYFFSRNDDGTYANNQYPFLKGVKGYLNADNTRTLVFKDKTTYSFDTNGRLVKGTDSNGNFVSITRDGNGNITGLSDNFGRSLYVKTMTITISRTIYTVISSISDAMGREVRYTYDAGARLISVTDPEGGQTSYTYESNRLSSVINKKGVTQVINGYGAYGKVTRQTHADGGVFIFSYPHYESFPLPCYASSRGSCISERWIWVPDLSVRDPKGNTTRYRFNGSGYATEITKAYGQKTTYERIFGSNELKSITDPLGRKTIFTYDANGNVSSVTDPAGNVTSYEYELVFNKPTKLTDALGNITTLNYDSKGNLIKAVSPQQSAVSFEYSSYGQPISITDALNKTTTFEYDDYGNLTKATDPLGNSATMIYDYIGRLTALIDPKGNSTFYSYDNLNRIVELTDALNKVTRFAYDLNGNLTTVTDAKNQVTSYEYDERDRVKKMTDPLGKYETYSYDKNDNLVSVTDRNNKTTNYEYNLLNRITKTLFSDNSSISYYYDVVGRLASVSDTNSGMIQYIYSNTGCNGGCAGGFADRVMQEITPLGMISYEYDVLGRRTKATIAGQKPVYYNYDVMGRPISLSQGDKVWSFEYDVLGRRISMTEPNGVTTTYSYDSASNLLELAHFNPSQIIEKLIYAFDPNGNRKSIDRLNVAPKLPQPMQATYNTANQMMTLNDKSMTYDPNGNMKTVSNSCGTTTYTWNVRNQLVGITGFNSDCSSLNASFKYDALGRRIEKTVNSKTIQYLYNGLDIIQEIEDGIVTVNYIRTLNIDEPLARIKTDGTVRYYQQDALGSVIALTDETGIVRTQYNYDPFGNTEMIGETSDNPFQYTGRENDGTRLYYYRARFYSPEWQRFISQDPIGFAGGDVTLYSYVHNRPTMFIDPMGLFDDGGRWAGGGGHADFYTGGNSFDYTREDHGPTSPYRNPERHFRDLSASEGDVARAIDSGDKAAFERAMHRGQDYFSHFDKGYRWDPGNKLLPCSGFGHICAGTSPDEDIDAWDKAQEWTKKQVKKWNDKNGCKK